MNTTSHSQTPSTRLGRRNHLALAVFATVAARSTGAALHTVAAEPAAPLIDARTAVQEPLELNVAPEGQAARSWNASMLRYKGGVEVLLRETSTDRTQRFSFDMPDPDDPGALAPAIDVAGEPTVAVRVERRDGLSSPRGEWALIVFDSSVGRFRLLGHVDVPPLPATLSNPRIEAAGGQNWVVDRVDYGGVVGSIACWRPGALAHLIQPIVHAVGLEDRWIGDYGYSLLDNRPGRQRAYRKANLRDGPDSVACGALASALDDPPERSAGAPSATTR